MKYLLLSIVLSLGLVGVAYAETQHGISPDLVIKIKPNIDVYNCKNTEQGCFDFVPENATVNLGEKVMIINNNDRLHDLRNCPYTPDGANMIWCNVHDIFGSGHLLPGHSSTWTANKAGNITLYDAYTNVQGTYTVVDPNANDDTDETSNENKGNENTCKDKVKKQKQLKNKWKKVYNECSLKLEGAYDAWNKTRHTLLKYNTTIQDLESKYNATVQQLSNITERYNEALSTIDRLKLQLANSGGEELEGLQIKYNLLESKYNTSISTINDKQFTIDKLQRELAEAKKKIEELESKDDIVEIRPDDTNDDSEQQSSDEQRAETPTISITIPQYDSLDNTGRTIDLYTGTNDRIRIDTHYSDMGTRYHLSSGSADITMFRDTLITNKQFTSDQDNYCYVGDLIVGRDSTISIQHTNTLKISFRSADDPTRCDQAPDVNLTDKLTLDKEVFVRFVGTDGQVPFYYDGTVNTIPKCTSDNFDGTSITSGKICYGKDGSDTVIVSKILTEFGLGN